MRIADELALRSIRSTGQTDDSQVPRSEILIHGRPTGVFIEGALLEGAVAWGRSYLLFLTDDIPNEEMLRILVVDEHLRVLDSALLGAPYSTGSFAALTLCEPERVQFRFIGATLWTLTLLSRARFRWPLVSAPPGVFRRVGFRRRFIVSGNPLPEAV